MTAADPDFSNGKPPSVVRVELVRQGRWWTKLLWVLFVLSCLLNLILLVSSAALVEGSASGTEVFISGDENCEDKIAILEVSGTIMPPYTVQTLDTIDTLIEDENVKGVLLSIDSPGGFVADSHQIYARLLKLRQKKPIFVSMGRIAASGGYYVAMGAGPDGKIFAEPTTWTGSIGVIIPRYDISKLATDYGVKSDPLVTGEFKDSLSPFREMTPGEEDLWQGIMAEAFDRFKGVIDEGRGNLTLEQIQPLASGRIFTANQAVAAGLIDQIGFEEDAIAALQAHLKLSSVRVVLYQHPPTLMETLLNSQVQARPIDPLQQLLDASTPRAMYFCGWQAGLTSR
jgi:protease IV